jgi:polyferredoxin
MLTVQQKRLAWRTAFFILFLLAPVLDIFRFDLTQNHFVFLWNPWTLGIEESKSAAEMTVDIFLRFLLPVALIVGGGIFISWKWGRLYCGWLCPHFSVVELINSLMRRASGKLSIWDKKTLPEVQQDGTQVKTNKLWWVVTIIAVFLFSFVWAVVLLTYLLPPIELYSNLFSASLTQNQLLFIIVATVLLMIEFTFARHLFCRFGCAIGLFQSLVWMGNKNAMVVSFDRSRAKLCADCDKSCEHACPMRLKPRDVKRHMFTCTQCMQCVEACENVQSEKSGLPLLKMLEQHCAHDASSRGFGYKPDVPTSCYSGENKKVRSCGAGE